MSLAYALPQVLMMSLVALAWMVALGGAASLWLRELRRPALVLGTAGGLGLLGAAVAIAWQFVFMGVLTETYAVTDGVLTTERWMQISQLVSLGLSALGTLALGALVAAVFVDR